MIIPAMRRGARVAESACLESTCAGNGTVGSNPTLSAIMRKATGCRIGLRVRDEPEERVGGRRFPAFPVRPALGRLRTGVLKGVGPLQGVTGAKRRREGAWPPSGSMDGVGHATLNAHPLRHHAESDRVQNWASSARRTGRAGGIRTGVLKGVGPLQGVTGAKRRREGAWPPSGSMGGSGHATLNAHPLRHDIRRKRRPHGATLSAIMRKATGCRMGLRA